MMMMEEEEAQQPKEEEEGGEGQYFLSVVWFGSFYAPCRGTVKTVP